MLDIVLTDLKCVILFNFYHGPYVAETMLVLEEK